MRVLTAKWSSLDRVSLPDAVVTGSEAKEEAKTELLSLPLFIYVTDGNAEDKIEKVVLNDNKVLVGMRAFKCVKMTTDAVANDPLISGSSKDGDYFIFVSRDYSKVKVVDGTKMKASVVFKTMAKFAKKDYKGDFTKSVKKVLKLLVDYDKVNNAKKQLLAKKEREGKDISKADTRKIEKELAELAKEQTKLEEQEKGLLKFKLKVVA